MDKFTVEYTDTFGGEANYSWVKRDTFMVQQGTPDSFVKTFAKDLMGIKGVRGRWEDMGDGFRFTPRGSCTVLFVTYSQE